MRRLIPLLLIVLAPLLSGQAQVETDFDDHPLQIFLPRSIDASGIDRLIFVDSLTGGDTPVLATGSRYTPLGRSVLYLDAAANQVMQAFPDGRVQPHPVIQPGGLTRRIDWIVAPDHKRIAWTLTQDAGADGLITTTMIARLDGSEMRQVLVDGPRPGVRALPVAFSPDERTLYMDYQPDSIADFTPFRQYAGLFSVDLETGETAMLPGEPSCFCGAGLGGGLLLRLGVAPGLSGFTVTVHNLPGRVMHEIAPPRLNDYTQGGDVLISPDGTRAVYALAQVRNFGGPNQSVRTVFMLVNLSTMTQAPLTDPITTFVQPVAWTEDNTAIIFTSPLRDGTWKVNLSDGRLVRVAEATYLGTLR